MSQLIETVNGWSEVWLGLMGAILWQSTLVAGVAALVAFTLLRRSAPGLRYWLWQIVAVKLLLMPVWTVGLPLPDYLAGHDSRPAVAIESDGSRARRGAALPAQPVLPLSMLAAGTESEPAPAPSWLSTITWSSWLLIVWLAVVAGQILRIVHQRIQLAGLLRRAAPATDERWNSLLTDVAHQIGVRGVPTPVLTQCDCSPFVFGLRRPVVVLPASLLPTLGAAQLRLVLLHELAHVKRRDLLWGWLPEIARLVYWFHPLAHWLCFRIQLDRELSCDQVAIAVSGQGWARYADTLIQVVGNVSAGARLRAVIMSSIGFRGVATHPLGAKESAT